MKVQSQVAPSFSQISPHIFRADSFLCVHSGRSAGMEAVSELMRPFAVSSSLIVQMSGARSLKFAKDLASGLASSSCSVPNDVSNRFLTAAMKR